MYVYVYVYVYEYMYVWMNVCVYGVFMNLCGYECMHVCVCMRVFMNVCMCEWICVYMNVCMCLYESMYVCVSEREREKRGKWGRECLE